MKLVIIEWVDSSSGKGWQPLDEIKASAGAVYCRSVGWVVAEDKESEDGEEYITLVPHISGEKNNGVRIYGSGDITIPKKAIIKSKSLIY